jgi:hypothetical protein
MKTIATLTFLVVLLEATVAKAGEGTPKEQVTALYVQFRSEQAGSAFQEFFKGSLVKEQKATQLKAVDTQAKSVFELYGKPAAIEIIDENKLSDSLTRIRWFTKHNDETPIFWSALFYKRHGKWEPLITVFYDSPDKIGI